MTTANERLGPARKRKVPSLLGCKKIKRDCEKHITRNCGQVKLLQVKDQLVEMDLVLLETVEEDNEDAAESEQDEEDESDEEDADADPDVVGTWIVEALNAMGGADPDDDDLN
jgi:hypothetical protein